MKILKMRLENFQGVKELEIDPQGESSAIYGDNGTGKSTVYNAFTWLMYGKPSTTEKNYTPKTTGSHNLHHSVEMTVELADGSEMVLKKDYHEVYKTIKGNPQPVLSGHTTDYSMDGVPVSETQFKKNLLEIYHDEELAKMLTSYNYFLENMKVADRRKILLQVCGDADFNEVIESQGDLLRELPEMLRKPGKTENYYTVDEYRAIAAKEKSLTDKELGDIPQRIDEAERGRGIEAVNDLLQAILRMLSDPVIDRFDGRAVKGRPIDLRAVEALVGFQKFGKHVDIVADPEGIGGEQLLTG